MYTKNIFYCDFFAFDSALNTAFAYVKKIGFVVFILALDTHYNINDSIRKDRSITFFIVGSVCLNMHISGDFTFYMQSI